MSESLEIARILAGAGFAEVYCTPHCIRGLYDNTPQIVRRAVVELQAAIDRAGFLLRLHPGMEYFLDEYFAQQLNEPLPLGGSNCLLVETSVRADLDQTRDQLFAIRRRGFIPLMAHPERYKYLAGRTARENVGLLGRLKNRFYKRQTSPDIAPDLLHELRAMGCRFQGNLGSFAGIYGQEVKSKSELFLAADEYDCFGSDAHRSGSLGKTLAQGLARVGRKRNPLG